MPAFYTLITEIEVPRPGHDDGFYYPSIEIEFGCEPGPRPFSDEPPMMPDIWVRGARVVDNGGLHLTSGEAEVLATEYLDSIDGAEHAARTAGCLV